MLGSTGCHCPEFFLILITHAQLWYYTDDWLLAVGVINVWIVEVWGYRIFDKLQCISVEHKLSVSFHIFCLYSISANVRHSRAMNSVYGLINFQLTCRKRQTTSGFSRNGSNTGLMATDIAKGVNGARWARSYLPRFARLILNVNLHHICMHHRAYPWLTRNTLVLILR